MDISYQIPRAALGWMLISVLLVIIPLSVRMPVWVSVIAIVCIVWRALIFTGNLNFPGRLMRIAVVVFTLIISVSQMRNLGVGLDSAASLLALGFVFKLIEMRQKRDIYVVISLCFVMLMVAFLYSQSVLMTLYIAAVVTIITGAMIALNRSPLIVDTTGTLAMAGKIFLQAVPLTVVLFMVFPRIAPLWAVPIQSNSGTTGVTDEMSPGDISQLGRSGDLAFRVQFENTLPPLHQDLYWRGLVLDAFDGETWRRTRSSSLSSASALTNFRWNWEERIRTDGSGIYYNVILEPTQQPWIYGLHLAQPQSRNVFQSRNFELFNDGLITQRLSYDLLSFANNQTDLILRDNVRSRNLGLPTTGNAQSREFARQLRASVDSNRDYAFAVLAHFQRNQFFYTLNPALLGENRIDDFLFSTLEGFCEHYASTFAFLMRTVGIPSRVIVGYQGAEYNRFENYMMVYQYNAHAWNEVWLEGEGWVRFDPTAAVSPERIEIGVEAALRDDPAFLEESLFSAMRLGRFSWLNTMRLRLDAIEYEWNRRVVSYDEEAQFELFERLFGEITEQKVLLLLLGLAGIVILGVALTVIRIEPGSRHDPVTKLYLRVSRELEKIGLARLRGEGPLNYRDRVAAAKPELAGVMGELTALYVELNYRSKRRTEAQMKQQLKAFRRLLGRLRLNLSPLARLQQ